MLMTELKKMCESWQTLSDQSTQTAKTIAKKDEHVVKLMQDKVKLDAKIAIIMKQNTLCNNNMVHTQNTLDLT